MKITPGEVTKAIACLVVTFTGAVAQGLITGAAAAWISLLIGALATAGVYAAPPKR